jgi:diadenosine tetraphosphatase ApaH/serine/threonine PP2A family protein phosphatase
VHFLNTGSLGRPKDGDWRAGYALVSIEGAKIEVELRRVEYDVERAARAIQESELPDDFAAILRAGG